MKTDNVRMIPKARVMKVLEAGGKLKLFPQKHQVILTDADDKYVGEVGTGTFVHVSQEMMYSTDYDVIQEISISKR